MLLGGGSSLINIYLIITRYERDTGKYTEYKMKSFTY